MSQPASTLAPVPVTGEFLGHPKGLYTCFLTEMWERFAFYGMKALLLLYVTQHHGFSDDNGYLLLGTYAGLAYALPLVGGLVADRWLGMRKAVILGGLLLVVGQLGMAYTGQAAERLADGTRVADGLAVQVMYASLAFIAMGVGFLKPNISTIVGRLYAETDARRDSAFTIFYMGINVGAALSGLIVGYVGIEYGWGWGFGLGGVMMALGVLQFVWGTRHLLGQAEPADPAILAARTPLGLSREWTIYLLSLLGVVAVWQVLQIRISFEWLHKIDWLHEQLGDEEITLTEVLAVTLGTALLVWFFRLLFSGIDARARGKMITLMALIISSVLFWGLYEQTYGPWVAMADRAMDLTTAGITWNAPQTTSFGAIFVILFTPLFVWLWPKLDRAGLNPSYPAKFGWAFAFCGLSFAILAFATGMTNEAGMVSLWWMILAYAALVAGEMLLSPIGLSAVTALSLPRVLGLMMGAWFLASAFGEMLAGRLAKMAALDELPDGGFDIPVALATYGEFFTTMMWWAFGAALVMFALTPVLKRSMRD